jgi:dynein heavy chain
MVLKIGESVLDYNPAFRLYLSTKLSNPKLAPETYARLNVLNFSATSEGLVEQMLGIVVTSEAPDLEIQSEQQRREIADYGKLVADMEDKVGARGALVGGWAGLVHVRHWLVD